MNALPPSYTFICTYQGHRVKRGRGDSYRAYSKEALLHSDYARERERERERRRGTSGKVSVPRGADGFRAHSEEALLRSFYEVRLC